MEPETILQYELPGMIFTALAVVFFLVIRHQNLQRYRIRLETIQKERLIAMEKGVPMPELHGYDDETPARSVDALIALMGRNPRWPISVGSVLIVGGIGTCVALMLSLEPYHNRVWSMGLIPVSIGLGLLLQYRLTRP